MIRVLAPAKVNLALHITGQRDDGYHELDSIVVLVDHGDILTVSRSDVIEFAADGPFGDQVPLDNTNLVLRAVDWLSHWLGTPLTAKITLTKNLPSASGIGGGSSDAAATIKGLCRLYDINPPAPHDLVRLGADVPVCMGHGVMRMRGIGETITQMPLRPNMHLLLVNPRLGVHTPDVFRAISQKNNPALVDAEPNFFNWIGAQRNDMQSAAINLVPVIHDVITSIAQTDSVVLARMSGSGATCFGIYTDQDACLRAASRINRTHPDWWVSTGQPILDVF